MHRAPGFVELQASRIERQVQILQHSTNLALKFVHQRSALLKCVDVVWVIVL